MNVLLEFFDKLVNERNMGYYLKCKNIDLIYLLSFVDDIMVFIDGIIRLI